MDYGIEEEKLIFFAVSLAIILLFFFFLIPQPFSAASPTLFSALLFQFFHFSATHLLENIVGLAMVTILSIEMKLKFREFILFYLAGVYIALPLSFLFPLSAIAGSSTGIYAVLAATLVKGKKYLSWKIIIPSFAVFAFSGTILSFLSGSFSLALPDLFHLAGFIAGAVLFEFIHQRLPEALRQAEKQLFQSAYAHKL